MNDNESERILSEEDEKNEATSVVICLVVCMSIVALCIYMALHRILPSLPTLLV